MPVEAGQEAFDNDRATSTVELGPRSLALLRRMCLALETLTEHQYPDPGKQFEDDAAQFGAD